MSYTKAFNNTILQFLDDCILLFRDDVELKVHKTSIEWIIKYNPKKIITMYKEYMDEDIRQDVLDKKERVFLEYNFESKLVNYPEIAVFIDKIKYYWNTLDVHNKNKVWEYMILLITLSNNIK